MSKDNQEVKSPKEVQNETQSEAKTLNKNVERAGEEAAKRLEGQSKERFSTVDAVLGEDEKHGIEVKKAQAKTNGTEYDPKTDKELNPEPLVPSASQNQNNLKHPEDEVSTDPHASRNYMGQVI